MKLGGYRLKKISKPHCLFYDYTAEKDGKQYYAILGFQLKNGTNNFFYESFPQSGNIELTIIDPKTDEPVDFQYVFQKAQSF